MIGPTKEFPFGKPLRAGDRGGCYAKFGRVPNLRILAMDFGTTLQWLGVPPALAIQQAQTFRALVEKEFGKLSYDASSLPFKVEANKKIRMVETNFPAPLGVLAANPEVFLAWADKLDAAAKELAS